MRAARLRPSPGDDHEDDFVLLADAFVTGWHATELASVGTGPGPVAVFGAGAVGLLAAQSALLKGAGEVHVVDGIDAGAGQGRRARCHTGRLPPGDRVAQIRELRRSQGLPDTELPTQVIDDLARLANPTGHLGIAGVYADHDLHPARHGSASGALTVPWATLFNKGVSVGFGRTHDRRDTTRLRDLVVAGRAHPGRIVTHHGTLRRAQSASAHRQPSAAVTEPRRGSPYVPP